MLNVTFVVVNLNKFLAVTASVMIAFMRLLWIDCINFATFKTLFKLLAKTHFFLAFGLFMGLETIWSIKISHAVFAVNGTFLAWEIIGAAAIIFLRTGSLTTTAIFTLTGMMSCVVCIEPLTAIRAKIGSIQKRNHAS